MLRALPLLDGRRARGRGRNACRSSVQPVFEAVACDTTYAAQHFATRLRADGLKALFVGVPLGACRLRERTNPELSRMAPVTQRAERRGRTVPEDIDRFFPR